MMRKINVLLAILLLATPRTMSAQEKLFTLEDLNYGGTNFFRMLPQNEHLTWWGGATDVSGR